MLLIIVFVFFNVLCEISANHGEVISTKSGLVRGIIQSSAVSAIRVQKFLNIPYAEAPVGMLRFEKPQPKKPWNGTLNSTENLIACIQPHNPKITITEDCLILNVWTPYPRPQNASVMVWIHGGGFRYGYSGEYEGSNFVAVGDVILVTINYRLTALGFLTSGDDRIKGNIGLYDQRLAMKWVRENIANFGGNEKSITIFGESAGGASVSAHTLSKESWELFDRAIMQSGNMLMPWSIMTDSQIKDGLNWFLRKVNCINDKNLLECLRNVAENKWKTVVNNKDFWSIRTAPVVDREFFPDNPRNLFEKGEVKYQDIITGITKDEMFLYTLDLLESSKNISFYLKHFEGLLKTHFKNSSETVYKNARKLYLSKCVPSYLEALKPIVAFSSDEQFICATKYEAKQRTQIMNKTNVYLFQYSHAQLVMTFLKEISYPYGTFGFAGHGLDVISVFGFPINNTMFRPDDQTLSMRMILYWTNFAKTGDPNSGKTMLPIVVDKVDNLPYWPRHTNKKEEFLDMGSFSQMTVGKNLRKKQCEFLRDPEGFTDKKTNGAATNFFTEISAWFLIIMSFNLCFSLLT